MLVCSPGITKYVAREDKEMTEKGDDLRARRAVHQPSLFPPTLDELIAEILVSADEMKSWHSKGWLSFDPAAKSQYEEWDRIELLFIKGIAHSGLSDAMNNRLLSAGLEKPYCYDPTTTFFSFCQKRWISLPSAPDPDDMTKTYIDELASTEDWPALRELQERINQAPANAEVHEADDAVEGPEKK